MGSFKKLNKADITTVPYNANKRWNFTFQQGIVSGSFSYYEGKNFDFFSPNNKQSFLQYNSSVYDSINHLFYQEYTSNLDTGSLMFNVDTYVSASSQRPTSSYFNYNDSPYLIKSFPTAPNNSIKVLSINKTTYGNKILPGSLVIKSLPGYSSNFYIADDGYGNLYEISAIVNGYYDLAYITQQYFTTNGLPSDVTHVGNVFYAHGIIVITDSLYASYLPSEYTKYYTVNFKGGRVGGNLLQNQVKYRRSDGVTVTVDAGLAPPLNTICIEIDSPIQPLQVTSPDSYELNYPCNLPATSTPLITIAFENEHIIYENEVRCIVRESDFNLSYNPTLVSGSYISGSLRNFATGSDFQPYVTSIGLYNDENDLLMVAKLGKPIVLSSDTDMTFIVRYDT